MLGGDLNKRVFLFGFEKGLPVTPAGLELVYIDQAGLNRSTCLSLESAGIKGHSKGFKQ